MTSFCIETSGSRHHLAEAERMAGLLQQARFEPKEKVEDADIVILNPCTISEPGARLFLHQLKDIRQNYPYKIIIVAGCLPQTDPEELKGYPVLATGQIHHIVEVVEEALHNNIIKILGSEESPLNLPKIRRNQFIEVIPITYGCANACTFCQIKDAPTVLSSYPVSEIVEAARKALQEGVKEIWLTSQDVVGYGFDKNTTLPTLLKELTALPGDFKIWMSRGNPVHLQNIKEELFPLLNHEKMFRFLHLPIYSGSNRILRSINSRNTVEEFSSYVDELRLKVPLVTLATDAMVGFQIETEEDYWETLTMVRKLTPDLMKISRSQIIPKKSTKMRSLPEETIAHRLRVLTDIFTNISKMQNERWVGWQGDIILEEKGNGTQWIGRNLSYKPVVVEGDYKLGDVLMVKITKAGMFELRGEVIR